MITETPGGYRLVVGWRRGLAIQSSRRRCSGPPSSRSTAVAVGHRISLATHRLSPLQLSFRASPRVGRRRSLKTRSPRRLCPASAARSKSWFGSPDAKLKVTGAQDIAIEKVRSVRRGCSGLSGVSAHGCPT
ncbi:hypothetical protein AAHA92_06490 [Salvia divinorum]|uniref:Uncharacterized protein n=1 Tax=Salvia divinorum TaxID=28513 RepID=A0ABD1I6L3_SALDI